APWQPRRRHTPARRPADSDCRDRAFACVAGQRRRLQPAGGRAGTGDRRADLPFLATPGIVKTTHGRPGSAVNASDRRAANPLRNRYARQTPVVRRIVARSLRLRGTNFPFRVVPVTRTSLLSATIVAIVFACSSLAVAGTTPAASASTAHAAATSVSKHHGSHH